MLRSSSGRKISKRNVVEIVLGAILIGTSFGGQAQASATNSKNPNWNSVNTFLGKLHAARASNQVHLPRYSQLIQLSPAQQARYIKAFQDVLLEMDKEVAKKGTRSTAEILLDYWLADACAEDTYPAFCINVGVVRAAGDGCDLSDPDRHNFDSRDDLKDVGDILSQSGCTDEQKPCSPVFGFNQHGSVLCGSNNLTSSCLKASKASKVTSFAAVIQACSKPDLKSKLPQGIDCDKLAAFFDEQTRIVDSKCQPSPATKACGILKAQLTDSLRSDVKAYEDAVKAVDQANNRASNPSGAQPNCPQGTVPSTTPNTAAQNRSNVSAASVLTGSGTTNAGGSNAGLPNDRPAPASVPPVQPSAQQPAAPAQASQSGPATANNGAQVATAPTNCSNVNFPATQVASVENLFAVLTGGDDCIAVTLPNQAILQPSSDGKSLQLQFPAANGTKPDPINITDDDFKISAVTEGYLQGRKYNFKVPDSKLFGAYFPTKLLTDTTKISDIGDTRGWLTADGWKIQYVPAEIDKKSPTIDLYITDPNGRLTKENFPNPDLDHPGNNSDDDNQPGAHGASPQPAAASSTGYSIGSRYFSTRLMTDVASRLTRSFG